ncbi:MAG: LPS export ABC transporter periplasmic protein LptC [Spirochaetaceae bacterium]|nr:LPS export ABC transporter periplasmic protein LptC [Spirochaetaceae bacterium]
MKNRFFLFVLLTLFSVSCSLNYGKNEEDFLNNQPEFIFSNIHFTQIQNNKKITTIQSDILEQYEDPAEIYGKNLTFTLFDDFGKISATGKSDFFIAYNNEAIYTLLGNVSITNYQENMLISGGSLKWDNKNQQLVSGLQHDIAIKTANEPFTDNPAFVSGKSNSSQVMQIEGRGLSASGLSENYHFSNSVQGTIFIHDEDTIQ